MRCSPQQDWPELKYAPSTMFSIACGQVGIVAHVDRIAAAQFQAHADEALGGHALHRAAAGHRAGEGHEVDARDRGSRASVSACSRCNTWKTPGGQSGGREAFRKALGTAGRLR